MIPVRVRPGRPVMVAAVAVTALIGGAGVALAVTSSSVPRTPPRTGTVVDPPSPSPSPVTPHCQIILPWRGFPPPGPIVAIPGPPEPFGFGPLAGFGPLGAIHGQFVAPKPGGGYQTIDTQRGTVTAVSSSSITVKSSDGYTKTYQVTSSTNVDAQRAGIGSVKTGQTVSVFATVTGSSATATQIVDFTTLPRSPAMRQALKPGSPPVFRVRPCASGSTSR